MLHNIKFLRHCLRERVNLKRVCPPETEAKKLINLVRKKSVPSDLWMKSHKIAAKVLFHMGCLHHAKGNGRDLQILAILTLLQLKPVMAMVDTTFA